MGARGPRARTPGQKAREGYGAASGDAFAGTNADRPAYLKGYAATRFDFWWAQLSSVKRQSAVDADLLASLCEFEADERRIRRALSRAKMVIKAAGNQQFVNPLVKQLDLVVRMKRGLMRDLALTPKERKTAGAPPLPTGQPAGSVDEFNARRPTGPPPGLKVSHG